MTVETILDGYWQSRPADVVKIGILTDWMDTLEDWRLDQIKAALVKWRNTNPSKKPNPGHILAILKAERGKAWASERAGQPSDPVFSIGRDNHQYALEAQK